MSEMSVKIETPQGHHDVHVPAGHSGSLADLLRKEGLPLNTRCGQRGLCDGCVIELLGGSLAHTTTGQSVSGNGHPIPLRGCEYRPHQPGTVSVRVPQRAMLAYQPQVVTDFRINVPRAHHPLVQHLEIPAGGDADSIARLLAQRLHTRLPVRLAEGVAKAIASAGAPLHATIEHRVDHWAVTAAGAAPDLAPLGAAIDIGTTTVAVLMVDLRTGNVVGRSAAFNEQMRLADDVVTRITLCATDPQMLGRLQEAVNRQTILPLLEDAMEQAGISTDPHRLKAVALAGNTTMLHLAAGVDPTPMGVSPFTAAFLDHRLLTASQLLADADTPLKDACFHLLPGASAYIGADLTAGALASGLLYDEGPSLLVDVGTNGEILFKHGKRMLGCATAAGPAFEGAGLTCGIRAGNGAISHISLRREPFELRREMIGHEDRTTQPAGLCGSAYIDFLAHGRNIGLLNTRGRFDFAAAPQARQRLIDWHGHAAFLVERGQGSRPIVVCETDVAKLLQAKAAIAAGILTLLERVGTRPDQIKRLYLAGGFGTHMDAASAIGCGLLPGFSVGQIQPMGNTALAGAYLGLLDSGAIDEMARIGRQMEVVELNLDPRFEERYIDQLSLPAETGMREGGV